MALSAFSWFKVNSNRRAREAILDGSSLGSGSYSFCKLHTEFKRVGVQYSKLPKILCRQLRTMLEEDSECWLEQKSMTLQTYDCDVLLWFRDE
jgi:hypothetical protein